MPVDLKYYNIKDIKGIISNIERLAKVIVNALSIPPNFFHDPSQNKVPVNEQSSWMFSVQGL